MIKIVNTSGLNMRKGAGVNYPIIKILIKNTEVDVISESNGWSNIRYNGNIGYVSSQYLIEKVMNIPNPPVNDTLKKAIYIAKSKVGCAYVWGSEGPNTFDCSGLIYYIFKTNLNINIPRVSKEQSKFGQYVDRKDLKQGDLVFFDTDGVNNGNVTHVGIYLGNNEFIGASSGNVMKVVISKLEGYYDKQYVTGRRIL